MVDGGLRSGTMLWEQGVAGSNPVAPTMILKGFSDLGFPSANDSGNETLDMGKADDNRVHGVLVDDRGRCRRCRDHPQGLPRRLQEEERQGGVL